MIDKSIPNYKKMKHTCDLHLFTAQLAMHGEKSLHRCGHCKQWWFATQLDSRVLFFKVRVFNFRMRRKIRKAERPGR